MHEDEDYENWEDWHRLPGLRQNRSSDEQSNRRKLRRNPSAEDKAIRKRDRRTASEEANDRGDLMALDRGDIIRAIQKAATLDEQLALVAALEEFDRNSRVQAAASRGQWDAQDTVKELLTPVRVHEHHTAATDWIADIDTTPSDWHQRVVAEAAVWYANRPDFVKADREEFGIQLESKASQVAGAFGMKREAARRTFLDYVAFLHTAEVEDGPGGGSEGGSEGSSSGTATSSHGESESGSENAAEGGKETGEGSSTGTATPPTAAGGSSTANPLPNGSTSSTNSGTATQPITGSRQYWAASGLDQIQQVTAPDGVTHKTTPLPADVFDNFAPDIDPVNKGVSGTETSTRNPLLNEISGGGSHMDGGSAEQVGGHSTSDQLSWSPPSGMQADTSAGFSDGDPGSPEDRDEHETSFQSDSPYSKHAAIDAISPAIGYVMNMDDYRRMQAEAARRAEGKGEGRRGGHTAAVQHNAFGFGDIVHGLGEAAHGLGTAWHDVSQGAGTAWHDTAQGLGTAYHDLTGGGHGGDSGGGSSSNSDQSSSDSSTSPSDSTPAPTMDNGPQSTSTIPGIADTGNNSWMNMTGKVARNLEVRPGERGRYHVVDTDNNDEVQSDHHSHGAAEEHIDFLNRAHEDHHGEGRGQMGPGWSTGRPYMSSLFHNAASGLDQIDQVIDPNNAVKVTDYPTEVAFPLTGDFQEECSTHGTGQVGSGNENPQPSPQHQSTPAKVSSKKGIDVGVHRVYHSPDDSAMHSDHVKVNDTPLDFGHGVVNGSKIVAHVPSPAKGPVSDRGSGYAAHIYDPTFRHPMSGYHATPEGAAGKAVDQWLDAHRNRQASLQRDERILNKVADMYGGSDLSNPVLWPVRNSPETTPKNPSDTGKSEGYKDCGTTNVAPTFSDESSHIPAGANSYSEGYSDRDKDNYSTKNVPGSMAGPGKGVTHAGSRTASFNRNDTVNVTDGRGNLTGAQGRIVGGPHNDPYGTTYDVEHGNRSVKRYHETKLEHPNSERGHYEGEQASRRTASPKPYGDVKYADPSEGKYPIDTNEHIRAAERYVHKKHNQDVLGPKAESTERAIDEAAKSHGIGDHKASRLITTAADRSNPEFMKGYLYASKWKMTTPIVTEGSAAFEAGIYAGLTDNPQVQPHFVRASVDRGLTDRIDRHASITQTVSAQLGFEASTSLYLDTAAPNTSPAGDGSTPINGHGRPGPLDGKETGEEGPGGPAPYNGAAPYGHSVVPGAQSAEKPSPSDKLVPDSGYTTPRAVEKASSFRRAIQAGLLREGKLR